MTFEAELSLHWPIINFLAPVMIKNSTQIFLDILTLLGSIKSYKTLDRFI